MAKMENQNQATLAENQPLEVKISGIESTLKDMNDMMKYKAKC
jgi:hypothetical protein